jgi:hypothetical protein
MTDEQYLKAQRYIINAAAAAEITIAEPDAVIRFILENPLPEDFEAQVDVQLEDEKQARIIALREELTKLEAPTRETS